MFGEVNRRRRPRPTSRISLYLPIFQGAFPYLLYAKESVKITGARPEQ